jgi:hypothetical protein
MSKKTKRRKVFKYYRRKRPKKVTWRTYLGSRLLEITIALAAILLLLYVFSLYKRLSQPEAKEQKELVFARTQILDGYRREGAADKVAEKLKGMRAHNVVYQIVEIGDLKDSAPRESLVLDRLGCQETGAPSEVALAAADALGIDRGRVICKILENNYRAISLTIVIGDDWERLGPAG